MTRQLETAFSVLVVAAIAAVSLAAAQQQGAPDGTRGAKGPQTACMDLGQSGLKDQDKQSMREFMQSKDAPATMAKMMAMARQMGNGDVHAGMAKMMDMMGSGGMMGGRGGMMGGQGQAPPGERPSTK